MDHEKLYRGLIILALAAILYCINGHIWLFVFNVALAIIGVAMVWSATIGKYLWWLKK